MYPDGLTGVLLSPVEVDEEVAVVEGNRGKMTGAGSSFTATIPLEIDRPVYGDVDDDCAFVVSLL